MATTIARGSIFLIGLSAFAAGLSGAVTPGPLFVACIGEVARHGFVASPLLVAGHAIPELLLVLLITWRAEIVIRARRFRRIATLLGTLALLALGSSLLHAGISGEASLSLEASSEGHLSAGPLLTGFVLTVLNPYWIVWWATVGAALTTTAARKGRLGMVSLFVGHESSDLAWYGLVGALVAAGRNQIGTYTYACLLIGCALAMFAMAVAFSISLVRQVRKSSEGATALVGREEQEA